MGFAPRNVTAAGFHPIHGGGFDVVPEAQKVGRIVVFAVDGDDLPGNERQVGMVGVLRVGGWCCPAADLTVTTPATHFDVDSLAVGEMNGA